MSATPTQFLITDEELADAGGGTYDALEVPQDYEATLVEVEDYQKNTKGWIFHFRIEGLKFRTWISHSDAARWKLIETVHAFRPGFFEERAEDGTTQPVNPNEWIGETVGAHVVLDESMDTPMKVIQYLFSLDEPEPSPDDVPVL